MGRAASALYDTNWRLSPYPSHVVHQVYAPNVVGAFLSLAQVGAFVLYSRNGGGRRGGAGGGGGGAKKPSLSEFLLEVPHGAGGSPAESLNGQEVTLL